MKITIKLFATLRKGRFEEKIMDFPEGVNIDQIVRQIALQEKDVNLIFINGRNADFNTPLSEGDTVSFFPPVGGG
ncbi:MAG TPA: MoaD/ThiS family protein [Desulfatiglandales bacterium]|nr:MoaD/ThiS family protein [Desulfatiglandales bacterium]